MALNSAPKRPAAIPPSLSFGLNLPVRRPLGQGFRVEHGVAVERPVKARHADPDARFKEMMASRKLGETVTEFKPTEGMALLPSHVVYAKQVLRFEGFFKEAVVESRSESHRVRRVTLLYYLEDDTMQLTEPKASNSGMPQGNLLKRHKIPRGGAGGGGGGGSVYTWKDLVVGDVFTAYGRAIKVVSCDKFTRDFYGSQGYEQPGDGAFPDDPFTTLRKAQELRETGADSTVFRGKKANPMKRYMEATLGNASAVQIRGVKDGYRKFLDHDREVLRFYGVWDDRDAVYGDLQKFRVHYFLADDTVEVLEVHEANDGRDKWPCLLKRQRLPKRVMYQDDRSRTIEDDCGDDDYYTEEDFEVGREVNVLGRQVLLYDADAFTMEYYAKKGIDMRGSVVDVSVPKPEPPTVEPPPYTGYGTEEDSLGSFFHLVPKPPKRDLAKLMAYDKKVLRFTARFARASKVDSTRKFIVTFYCANDTVAVFEPPQRNTGVIGGKFLARSRLRNPATGVWFQAEDFVIGKEVTINRCTFVLDGCDDYTKKQLAGDERTSGHSDVAFVIKNLRRKLQENSISARRMFRVIDKDFSGFITIDELDSCLRKYGMEVTREDLVKVMAHYDVVGDGQMSYEDFCEVFLDKSEAGGVKATTTEEAKEMDKVALEHYANHIAKVQMSMRDETTLQSLLMQFHFLFTSRTGEQAIRNEFRKFDVNKDHHIDRDEFRKAMGGEIGAGQFNLSGADIDILEKKFFPEGVAHLDYENFMCVLREQVVRASRRTLQ